MSGKNALEITVDLQGFTFETGKEFRGLTVSRKDAGWNVVIRATDADGTPVYCISQGEDIIQTAKDLWSSVMSADAKYFWRLDGWAR